MGEVILGGLVVVVGAMLLERYHIDRDYHARNKKLDRRRRSW